MLKIEHQQFIRYSLSCPSSSGVRTKHQEYVDRKIWWLFWMIPVFCVEQIIKTNLY